jgi:hypothetical protein
MPTIILNHRVSDYNKWRPLYDGDHERRKNAGLKELKVGRKSGDPNLVYIIFEAKDTAGIESMLHDPDLKVVMDKGGVISQPEVVIID